MKNLKGIFTSFLILFGIQMLISQGNFIQLNDASGRPATQIQIDSLNAAADRLVATIDLELPNSGQFKVFDVGFFLHERDYTDGFPKAFQRAIDAAAAQSTYYLLFGRQTDDNGANSKIWIKFVFPEDDFICIDNIIIKDNLQKLANEFLSEGKDRFYTKQKESLEELNEILKKGFCCSGYLGSYSKSGYKPSGKLLNSCPLIDQEVVLCYSKNAIVNKADVVKFLQNLAAFYLWYKDCQKQQWKSLATLEEKGKGIIPYCIWEGGTVSPSYKYRIGDDAFFAGIVDGVFSAGYNLVESGYETGKNLVEAPGSINKAMNMGKEYFYYKLDCQTCSEEPPKVEELFDALRVSAEDSSLWSDQTLYQQFKTAYDALTGDEEAIKMFFAKGKGEEPRADCESEELQKRVEQMDQTLEYLLSLKDPNFLWEEATTKLPEIISAIEDILIEMFGDIDGTEEKERYYQAHYSLQALSEIVDAPLKLLKANKILKAIYDMLDSNPKKIPDVNKKQLKTKIRGKFLNDFMKRKPFIDWDHDKQRKFASDFEGNDEFADWILKNEDKVVVWESTIKNGIDASVRSNPRLLNTLFKFPFVTGKKEIVNRASDEDFIQLLSGKLKDVPDKDPSVSLKLRNKFGSSTKTSKRYGTDPSKKEFDAITDDLLIEHKSLTSTNSMSSEKRTQMKYQMRACKALEKDNYLMFEGVRNDDWINKAIQYANQYQVNTKIELNGTIIHDITF